jgi:hypothetical protein
LFNSLFSAGAETAKVRIIKEEITNLDSMNLDAFYKLINKK